LRLAALEALGRIPDDGSSLFGAARHGGAREAAAAWTSLRERAAGVPADTLRSLLTSGLERGERDVVWRVLRCAERAASDTALARVLAPFARARPVQIRVHALRALGAQANPAALAALLASGEQRLLLPAADAARARIALARALGRVGHALLAAPGAEPVPEPELNRLADLLVEESRQRDPHVARTALEAMAALVEGLPLPPEAAVRESLLPVWRLRLARAARSRLTDGEPAVRGAAALAYGSLRGEAATTEIVPLAKDPAAAAATAAVTALGRGGGAEAWRLLREAAAPGRHLAVRQAALAAAGNLGAAAQTLPAGSRPPAPRAEVVDLLLRGARDPDFAVMATACEQLGRLGAAIPAAAWPVLLAQVDRAAGEGAADVKLAALALLEAAGGAGALGPVAAAATTTTAPAAIPAAAPAAAAPALGLPDSLRAPLRRLLERAFDDADRRVRLQGRAAALASGLVPGHLVPSEASLLATLPPVARDPRQPPLALPFAAPRLRCVTSRGEFVIALDGTLAPNTTATLLALARQGFYRDLAFHRVVPDFVIQGGDPRGDGSGGPGWTLRSELSRAPFERGTVGIADSGRDTGGSQFFVCHSAQPHLNGRYTVVGRVIKGMHVVDAIQPGDTFRLEVAL
jgi:cyclophilin family peptidyl-prolyl cis-trans isomerase